MTRIGEVIDALVNKEHSPPPPSEITPAPAPGPEAAPPPTPTPTPGPLPVYNFTVPNVVFKSPLALHIAGNEIHDSSDTTVTLQARCIHPLPPPPLPPFPCYMRLIPSGPLQPHPFLHPLSS